MLTQVHSIVLKLVKNSVPRVSTGKSRRNDTYKTCALTGDNCFCPTQTETIVAGEGTSFLCVTQVHESMVDVLSTIS